MGELGRRSFSYLRLSLLAEHFPDGRGHLLLSGCTIPSLFYGPLQASWLANDVLLSAKRFSSQFIWVKLALMQIGKCRPSAGFISKPEKYFRSIWFNSDGSDLRGLISLQWCSSHLLFDAVSTGQFIIQLIYGTISAQWSPAVDPNVQWKMLEWQLS